MSFMDHKRHPEQADVVALSLSRQLDNEVVHGPYLEKPSGMGAGSWCKDPLLEPETLRLGDIGLPETNISQIYSFNGASTH
jgi:hypothetical protein